MIDVALMLELIQQYGFLYDKSRKDFKDIRKKENAWEQIAETLHCEVDALKTRWRTLRERFVREVKTTEPRSGQGASEDSQCSSGWEWFDAMGFLTNHVKPRRTSASSVRQRRDSLIEERLQESPFSGASDSGSGSNESLDDSSTPRSSGGDDSSQKLAPKRPIRSAPTPSKNAAAKRLILDEVDTEILKRLKTADEQEPNADLLFGQMIGLELQKIADSKDKARRKMNILQIALGFNE